jgi:pyocin large subunit-like protein
MPRLLNNPLIQREAITSKKESTGVSIGKHLLTIASPPTREFQKHTQAQRKKSLDEMHAQLKKFIDKRLQAALVGLLNLIFRDS